MTRILLILAALIVSFVIGDAHGYNRCRVYLEPKIQSWHDLCTKQDSQLNRMMELINKRMDQ